MILQQTSSHTVFASALVTRADNLFTVPYNSVHNFITDFSEAWKLEKKQDFDITFLVLSYKCLAKA